MNLRLFLFLFLSVVSGVASSQAPKTLRVAFPVAENGFDPARISDLYSFNVTIQIFESLYAFDYLAIPTVVRALTAAAMPEHSPDFRTWTVRVRPGIYFTSDPAFKRQRRELTATDYVYSFKRFADPAVKSPHWPEMEELGIKGLAELRKAALQGKKPFDYDREIEGLRALDRYTLQFRLENSRPRLPNFLIGGFRGAVAREVVEAYGEQVMEHPVGTGPFVLNQWRRSSLIVLERNPEYREVTFDAQPGPEDTVGRAIAAKLRGRRIPMVDRVEISIITEGQPRWLSFVDGHIDQIDVPPDYIPLAMPGGRVAPYLERKGVDGQIVVLPLMTFHCFNMEDSLVGGYTADKVALRRAISLALNTQRNIRLLRGGLGIPAQSLVSVHLTGFNTEFRSEAGDYDPARSKALLDTFGYIDRDGDGWRDRPDGTPLVLLMASDQSQLARRRDEFLRRDLAAVGLRVEFRIAPFQENLKAARTGKLMMWEEGYGATSPDGIESMNRLYGPAVGGFNHSRFQSAEMDALYEQLLLLPDGPEREAKFDKAKRLSVAYMPEKPIVHRANAYLSHPWLIGYRHKSFLPGWYQFVDIDSSLTQPH